MHLSSFEKTCALHPTKQLSRCRPCFEISSHLNVNIPYFQGTDSDPKALRRTHLRILFPQGCNGSLKYTLHLSSFEKTCAFYPTKQLLKMQLRFETSSPLNVNIPYFQGTDSDPKALRRTHLRIVFPQCCNGSLKHTLHLSSFEKTCALYPTKQLSRWRPCFEISSHLNVNIPYFQGTDSDPKA